MGATDFGPLIGTAALAELLGADRLRVVDASWYLPAERRDPKAEYAQAHIPGAVYFDIDTIADTSSPLPHMFPDASRFADAVGGLGIGSDCRIVVYDGGKMASASRAWWMFRAFGHGAVAVLDGGFGKWRGDGHPSESGETRLPPARFEARFDASMVRSLSEMRAIVEQGGAQVLDARSAGRFFGTEPEPRAGMRSGHMPGAHNLPYTDLLAGDGTMRPADQLQPRFADAGIDLAKPVVTSCGSGVSAAVLLLGLHLLGHRDNALYDGSWAEWGSRQDTPVVT